MASTLSSDSSGDREFPKDFVEGPRAFLGGPKHPVEMAQCQGGGVEIAVLQSGFGVSADEPKAVELLWADRVAAASAKDTRRQPWKEALEGSLDQGAEGEDLINLQLPNHVQCGSLAA